MSLFSASSLSANFTLQSSAESNPKITEFVHFEIVRTESVALNEDELYLQKYIYRKGNLTGYYEGYSNPSQIPKAHNSTYVE